MPRDGTETYILPFPDVVSNTTIESPVYNGFTNDIAQDLNAPRPVKFGGTGANNADTALFNLSAGKAAQVVTNYDSHLWIPGSFYSASSATAPPVAAHAFSGIAYIGEALAYPPTNANVTLEARDATDGKLYVRRKSAGVWGAWTLDTATGDNAIAALDLAKVAKAGDTMTGPLVLPTAAPTLGTHATNKTYVDAGNTTLAAADTALAAVNTAQDTAIANRVRYDAAQGLSAAQQTQARTNISAPLRGHIAGVTLSAAGGTATFGIAAGQAADSTNVDLMLLASAFTKTSAAWVVGSGNGGLDTGAIAANTWYHVYLIKRPDTGVVDIAFSLNATNPALTTIPAAYTLFRRLGSMKTSASSQWIKFIQLGDEFMWDVAILDVNAYALTNSLAGLVVSAPLGVTTKALINYSFSHATAGTTMACFSPLTSITQSTAVPGGMWNISIPVAGTFVGAIQEVWTNTLSQLYFISSIVTAGTLYVVCRGWTDRRGRDV